MKISIRLYHTKKRHELLSSNDSLNRYAKAALIKWLRYNGASICRKAMEKDSERFSPDHPCTVEVTVFSPTMRESDADNVQPTVKALMDGFTDAGLWTDDNRHVVKSTLYQYDDELSGDKAYRIELDIKHCKRKRKKKSL